MEVNEVAAAPVDPVAAIKGILGVQTTDDKPVQDQSADDRPGAQEPDAGGTEFSGSSVDKQEPASDASVLDDEQDTEAPDDDDKPVTLKELAAHLELEPSDVYDMEVAIGDGKAVSLGELKDAYKEYGPVKEATNKIKEREGTLERELLATRAHINRILPLIPEQNRQAILAQAADSTKAWETEQGRVVLETIPSWSDAGVRRSDRDAINTHGAKYGFTQAEMSYTKDARMQRFMYDAMKDRQEIEGMRTASKKKTAGADAPAKPTGKATKQRKLAQALRAAKASNNVSDKRSAVTQLLRR
jgi:hypothetical protein